MRLALFLVGSLAACASLPPAAPVATPEVTVAASTGRTWDAVIDHFAETATPIRTLERASGLIVTESMTTPSRGKESDARSWADCGSFMGSAWVPAKVSYNVRVLGDSTRSTVRVTTIFASSFQGEACSTKGVLERTLQNAIKARAERR